MNSEIKQEQQQKILVNTIQLMKMLDCGKPTAVKVGTNAQAKVCIGRKILWNIKKVQEYVYDVSE